MVRCSSKRKRSCKQTKSCKWSKKSSSCKRRRSYRRSRGSRRVSSEAKLVSQARAILAYAQLAQASGTMGSMGAVSAAPAVDAVLPMQGPTLMSMSDTKAIYKARAKEAEQQKEIIRQQLRARAAGNVEEDAGPGDISPVFGGGRYGHYRHMYGGRYF